MSTAVAQPNFALIKYWGKVDEDLIIPATGSLSLTLDIYPTTTTVEVIADQPFDTATLDGVSLNTTELSRIETVLEYVRAISGRIDRAVITSTNSVPTAAGLASSASGFAALAVAASSAYGLEADSTLLSRIARRGSGSACRSIFDGLVRWNAGTTDETSHAEQLEWTGDELAMIIVVVSAGRKQISSREAMRLTAETSPYYQAWVESNNQLLLQASEAVQAGDFSTLGQLTELSTMRMHASMLAADPAIRYLAGRSVDLFDQVQRLRADGLECFATADAGPNVKILCRSRDASQVATQIQNTMPDLTVMTAHSGQGARLVEQATR